MRGTSEGALGKVVSKRSMGDHKDRPAWMGKVGFSDLKIKSHGATVATVAMADWITERRK